MYKQFDAHRLMVLFLSGILISHAFNPVSTYATGIHETAYKTTVTESNISNDHKGKAWHVGQVYNGFKLDSIEFSQDLNAQIYNFKHVKTGGLLVYLANEDRNKWFSIAFKTPAVDTTGVNHIIEHTVLEGSAKYQVKSPFTEMGKRSVNTYMNALTGTDVTYYPFASENDKDFKNLMGVYMDAVFAPIVLKNEKILKQEGWRYEVNQKNGKITYNGVVLNEINGTLSNPFTTVYSKMASILYPDTVYRYDSGGEVDSIVDLSHKQLVKTYKQYYQPSNACITLYGKIDVLTHLKFIDEMYYSKYSKVRPTSFDKAQETFETKQFKRFKYPGIKGQTPEEDSILTWSVKIDDASPKDLLGLSILADLLADPKSSIVYKKMAKNADENLYVDLDRNYYQPMFRFVLEGVDENQLEDLETTIEIAFKSMIGKGINKDRLIAMLNQYEVGCKYTLTSANRGETAIKATAEDFARFDAPTRRFNEMALLSQIRAEELSGDYFEKLIEKYLLDNPHVAEAVFVPDPNYMKKVQVRLNEKLNARISKMDPKSLEKLKNEALAFDKWQQTPNSSAGVNALPRLTLADIDLLENEYDMLIEKRGGSRFVKHTADTNGLSQVNMMFDLSVLSAEELQYIDLFTSVLTTASTKSYRSSNLLKLEEQYMSGLYFSDIYTDVYGTSEKYKAFYAIGTTFLKGNEDTVFNIFKEILTSANLNNKSLIKLRLSELVEAIDDERVYATSELANIKLSESMTEAGKLRGMRYHGSYDVLKEANQQFDNHYTEIQGHLDSIYSKLFSQHNMLISITSDEAGLSKIGNKAETLMTDLSSTKREPVLWQLTPMAQKTAIVFPSEMQYIELGFNFNRIGEQVSGKDLVFAQLISEGYMYEKIRMKGGAYGGSLRIDRSGTVQFSTYRDPNLKTSIEAIQQLTRYLRTLKLSQAELDNAIIAVAGRIGQESDLLDKIYQDDVKLYTSYSKEDQDKFIKEILDTKVSDLNTFTNKLEKGLANASLVVAGSETEINACKEMFEQIIKIEN